jgi:hypothetical protein
MEPGQVQVFLFTGRRIGGFAATHLETFRKNLAAFRFIFLHTRIQT